MAVAKNPKLSVSVVRVNPTPMVEIDYEDLEMREVNRWINEGLEIQSWVSSSLSANSRLSVLLMKQGEKEKNRKKITKPEIYKEPMIGKRKIITEPNQ